MMQTMAKKALLWALNLIPWYKTIKFILKKLILWSEKTKPKFDEKIFKGLNDAVLLLEANKFEISFDDWFAAELKAGNITTKDIE